MMMNHEVGQNVLNYLKNTFEIREFSETVKLQGFIDGYDRDKAEFVVAPWDIEQIALNCGIENSAEVAEALSEYPEFFSVENSGSGIKVVRALASTFPDAIIEEPAESIQPESLSVEDAFKWYLYHKINLLSNGGKVPVKISDGIFAIKNELFLPDDFVPRVMMEMVEGSKVVDVPETVKGIQPSGQNNAIIILGKHESGRFLEPHLFYFNGRAAGKIPVDRGNLGEKIAASFAEFQNTPEYENFLLSRVMRNVVFTVGTKKKRELGKPLFDPSKLKLLEKRGIVALEGNIGVVPDTVELGELNRIKAEAEKSAEKVSGLWMSSLIRL